MFRILMSTILLLSPAALAQRDRIIIADTPEGQLLQQIGQEEDTQKKLALME